MSDTVESFSALLRNALGDRLTPDACSFAEMFHPNGVMEFPYAFGELPKQVVGRDALIQHLSSLASQIADSDEAGHLFRSITGQVFRFHSGQHSDLKPATLALISGRRV